MASLYCYLTFTRHESHVFVLSRDKNCWLTWCFNLSSDIIWMLATYSRTSARDKVQLIRVWQKLSFHLVFQLVVRHHFNACDISTLARDKVRFIQVWRLSCRTTKIVLSIAVSTCRAISFLYLRHIHLSSRQGTTYLSMTSKSCCLSHFEHSLNWCSYIHSLCRYIIMKEILLNRQLR